MPLYIADYLADTAHLTRDESGGYLHLIMAYWRNGGPLPDDDKRMAAITKSTQKEWKKLRASMQEFFTVSDGKWIHKRIDAELANAGSKSAARRESGAKGAVSRWGEGTSQESAKATRSQRLALAREKATHTPDEWVAMLDVCGHNCLRCGGDGELVKDHIIPIYKEGSDGIDNIQPLCRKCNASKGSESIDYRPIGWRELLEKRLAKCLANAKQTPGQSPSPSPSEINQGTKPTIQDPNSMGEPNGLGGGCSAGDLTAAMVQNGIVRVNPGHPDLIALAQSGCTPETVRAAVAEAKASNNTPNQAYVVAILKRWQSEPAAVGNAPRAPPRTSDKDRSRRKAFLELTGRSEDERTGNTIDVTPSTAAVVD